jgi:glycosyltransferase involved in cell wall biosynthesis
MNSDAWGGSEELWHKTAISCLSKNIDVTCLVYHWQQKESRLKELKECGATILYIPNSGRKKENIWQRLRFEWITRLQQKRFINQINYTKFDNVLVNQGSFMEVTNNPWKRLYKRLTNYSITYHNYIEGFEFEPKKAEILKSWMEHAQHNFFASFNGCKVLEEQLENYSIPNQVVFINPITIPIKETATPYKLVTSLTIKMVVLASLEVERKAQDNLIKALSTEKWKQRNWVLEIYGSGKDFLLLQNLIKSLSLNNKVMLMGNSNKVAEVLENAHLVLQITHMDAMPIVVVEALCMARPVVVSKIGDMPLWVKENENGWIANDASIENIDSILEKAWSNFDQWEQMGEASFNIFKKKFPTSPEENFLQQFMTTSN